MAVMVRTLLSFLVLLVGVAPAAAHDLGAQCKLRGGRIEVTAYYDDDTSAGDARITILDAEKKLIAAGRTDSHGRWTCVPPAPGVYTLIVDGGAGHRVRLRIAVPSPGSDSAEGQNLITRTKEPSTPDEDDLSLNDGPNRREFTRFKLTGLLVGLAVLAIVALILWLLARQHRPTAPET